MNKRKKLNLNERKKMINTDKKDEYIRETREMSFDKDTIHSTSLSHPNNHPRYSHTLCPVLVSSPHTERINHATSVTNQSLAH